MMNAIPSLSALGFSRTDEMASPDIDANLMQMLPTELQKQVLKTARWNSNRLVVQIASSRPDMRNSNNLSRPKATLMATMNLQGVSENNVYFAEEHSNQTQLQLVAVLRQLKTSSVLNEGSEVPDNGGTLTFVRLTHNVSVYKDQIQVTVNLRETVYQDDPILAEDHVKLHDRAERLQLLRTKAIVSETMDDDRAEWEYNAMMKMVLSTLYSIPAAIRTFNLFYGQLMFTKQPQRLLDNDTSWILEGFEVPPSAKWYRSSDPRQEVWLTHTAPLFKDWKLLHTRFRPSKEQKRAWLHEYKKRVVKDGFA
jgi:hypothetical protein